jgi:hypothetical protein
MAYALQGVVQAVWIPEGAGPASVPVSQMLSYGIGFGAPNNTIPGVQITESTDGTLTAAQVNSACSAFGSLLAAQFGTISLATLQSWSTGGPSQ